MARVYIETSVVSYLTARTSGDLVTAAHQRVTAEWWQCRRNDFELVISDLVLDEAGRGDREQARQRLEILAPLARLELTEAARDLAREILVSGVLPTKALNDALHIAISAVHDVDYLLTWNCTHIANAELFVRIEAACNRLGYILPILCTPEELLGDTHAN